MVKDSITLRIYYKEGNTYYGISKVELPSKGIEYHHAAVITLEKFLLKVAIDCGYDCSVMPEELELRWKERSIWK